MMTNLVVLALYFLLGIGLRWSGRLPFDAHRTFNAFIVNVALPALIFRYIHDLHYDARLLSAALMPWVMFTAGLLFFVVAARFAGWSRRTRGTLILSGALANTSFGGLPMIEAFYAKPFLSVGILIDQLRSYMALSTVGVTAAVIFAGDGQVSWRVLIRKVLIFAPFQALIAGLLLIPIHYPDTVVTVLDRLGGTLTPLALVSVGYRLRLSDIRGNLAALSTGPMFKLVLAPAFIAFLLLLPHAGGKITQVTIFAAAMGPEIGAAIVAMEHGLDSRLVSLMVGLGIPLSLTTVAAWCTCLETFSAAWPSAPTHPGLDPTTIVLEV
jgi:predicted permease